MRCACSQHNLVRLPDGAGCSVSPVLSVGGLGKSLVLWFWMLWTEIRFRTDSRCRHSSLAVVDSCGSELPCGLQLLLLLMASTDGPSGGRAAAYCLLVRHIVMCSFSLPTPQKTYLCSLPVVIWRFFSVGPQQS